MGLHISLDTPSRPVMVADRALWADAEGKIVSGEDHPDAAQLVAGAGQPIPHDIADRYGLTVRGKSVVQQLDEPKPPKRGRASQQRQAAANPNIPHVHHDDAADAAAKAKADADAQAAADAQAKADADAAEEAAQEAAAVKAADSTGGAKEATPQNTKDATPANTKGAGNGGGRRRPASS